MCWRRPQSTCPPRISRIRACQQPCWLCLLYMRHTHSARCSPGNTPCHTRCKHFRPLLPGSIQRCSWSRQSRLNPPGYTLLHRRCTCSSHPRPNMSQPCRRCTQTRWSWMSSGCSCLPHTWHSLTGLLTVDMCLQSMPRTLSDLLLVVKCQQGSRNRVNLG
jgi:hypothetical protein